MAGIPWKLIEMLYEDIGRPVIQVIKGNIVNSQEPNTYVNKELGFKISWLDGWLGDTEIGEVNRKQMGFPITISIPIYILSKEVVEGIRPNINVVVEHVGSLNINEYVNHELDLLKSLGLEVVKYNVNERLNFATVEIKWPIPQGSNMYQIQRIDIHDRKAYTITVTELTQEYMEKNPKTKSDIMDIVQSFYFIKG